MNNQQWAKVEKPVLRTGKYPWGILGFFIILSIASVLFSAFIFFAYSEKYEIVSKKFEIEHERSNRFMDDLTNIKNENEELLLQNTLLRKGLSNADTNEPVAATGSGSLVDSSQTSANTSAGSNSIAPTPTTPTPTTPTPAPPTPTPSPSIAPIGKMHVNANISVPEFGPLWVHEELRLPVIGSYYESKGGYSKSAAPPSFLGTAWIQFFLVPPRSPIEGTLLLKAFYSAEHFGKPKWFQVPRVHARYDVSSIAGTGGSDKGNPSIDEASIELLELATVLGIYNQNNNRSALVRSWFDVEPSANKEPMESHIDDVASGNIDRVALNNVDCRVKFLQFDRDANQRVVAVNAYDSKGNTLGQMFRFEYAADNTLSQFSTLLTEDTSVVWTPVYNNGALTSLEGVGPSVWENFAQHDLIYRVSYGYDSRGRMTNIVYTETQSETSGDGNLKSPLYINSRERVLTASFVYKIDSHDHWSTAFVSGLTTQKWDGLFPSTEDKDLGMVRFEQAL